ncbi:MAG TPA: CHAT domain-containing protein [Umezawaea sp.]|nr:CHAT domain-containing protein [Umezawaea sp.]
MEFSVSRHDGDPLDAVAALTGTHALLVVADPVSWERISLGLEPRRVTTTVVARPAGMFTAVSIDLRDFRQSDRKTALALLTGMPGDVLAVHGNSRWGKAASTGFRRQLLGLGKPVVLFVEGWTELTGLDRTAVLIGTTGGVTVTGSPLRGVGSARVDDVLAGFDPSPGPVPVQWPDSRTTTLPEEPGGGTYQGSPSYEGPHQAFPLPPAHDRPNRRPIPPEARAVNSLVVEPGRDDAVPGSEPLRPGADYEVLVDIGPHRTASLLTEADARWPAENLPDGALALRAVLSMDGTLAPQVVRFTLPDDGSSFVCHCDTGHGPHCAREPWVRFPITTPGTPTVWTGELVVYYGVVAVHAQQLVLPVGTTTDNGLHARLLHRLTSTFADLGPLAERAASILVTDDGARALVNGVRFADNPTWISPNAADNAVRAARQLLHDIHLAAGPVSRLDAHHGKSLADFTADLADLARHGAVLYDRLFHDNVVFDTLPDLIRHEAASRARPAVLNIADPAIGNPDRAHPVPWSLVYDLPMPQDPNGAYDVCPSVSRFGPGAPEEPVPPHCPEPHHSGNTLCPFGFWGLSCVVEQPASTGSVTWHVHTGRAPASITMAVDPGLDPRLTDDHLTELRTALPPGSVASNRVTSPVQLAEALAPETMDVVYLYCHGGYHQLAANALPSPVLRFGDSVVDPVEVSNWRRNRDVWPRPHWPSRKPLVVMNGCHTSEMTTATLSNFVDAFANRAGAAGVVGTEVTVEQGMAGWAMTRFLRLLLDGDGAGQALREVRWRMINRGNVMGLAYTLYAVAGLRLRPPV